MNIYLIILVILLMSAYSLAACAIGKGKWKLCRIISFIILTISAFVVYCFGLKYEADNGIYYEYRIICHDNRAQTALQPATLKE
ncbi:hypothetical protein HYT26_00960 [Candidatus Pacearchaeota archaeon]|nr:hypothetical protein [Candidatus Pacearchaeota archaeon]